jgi:hypothetical protein
VLTPEVPKGLLCHFQLAPTATSDGRLIWLASPSGQCLSHLWWLVEDVYVGREERMYPAGLVHDMVTQPLFEGQGFLRWLVTTARTLSLPEPYCTDRSLTEGGARVAAPLGLISASDLSQRTDRTQYIDLPGRAEGHLAHPRGTAHLLGRTKRGGRI